MANVGFSKVFILDKYFTELQKFWETEKKLEGMQSDSSNEKAHLQQRLKSLSSELVSLRHHLHVNNNNPVESNNNGISLSINSSSMSNGYQDNINPSPNIIPINQNGHIKGNNINIRPYSKPLPPKPNQSSVYYVNQQFPKDVLRSDLSSGEDNKQTGSIQGGTRTNSSATPSLSSRASSFQLSSKSVIKLTPPPHNNISNRKVPLSAVEDLIHLPGCLTEDSLIRCLQARSSAGKHFVYLGPILLMTNPLNSTGNALTLNSTKNIPTPLPIQKVVQEALRQQADTGYPQAIILSGSTGSGKTYTSMLVLRTLFETAGCSLETDAYKHLTASISVLRSLGTAKTATNSQSSRIGHFIEVQVTDGSLYRSKVHCYFLDQSRVVLTSSDERNYRIFYEMLAGLSTEERNKLHLKNHSAKTLRYLNSCEEESNLEEDARRFLDWKTCLYVLGIPFLDVVRVLAAVILIGNVKFKESSSCLDLDVEEGESELQSVASLLGVSETALRQGLTNRTVNTRGHLVRSRCDANLSNTTRDALAKSLYCRTVATIVRRANSLKRLSCNSGTLSSDSADSIHQTEVASQHASTVGTAGSKASKSMTALRVAVRNATDGFIGILDMFGFENVKRSRLEHLCINLCAETMQHFYNTHIFKACIESCKEEGIQCDEIEYHDNVPCIDLISSLRTGLLSMLDVECSLRGTVETYIQKVKNQHNQNPILLETKDTELRSFAIQHYAGKVYYDATDFPETNRDVLADDLIAVFHKHRCSFGFANHLFSSELKVLGAGGSIEPCPKGISFRILPTSNIEMLNGDEPVSTLTQDFHSRLDNLLRTLVHAKPHFIHCIKINESEEMDLFDRHTVSKQIRAFQVLETLNLMAYGYPHRMRLKAFNSRFKLLTPPRNNSRAEDSAIEDAHRILTAFDKSIKASVRENVGNIFIGWAVGKRHVFLSEGTRQELENLRISIRNRAATLIQSTYRGWYSRRRWPIPRKTIHQQFMNLNEPKQQQNLREPTTHHLDNPPPPIKTMHFNQICQNGVAFSVPVQRTSSSAAAVVTSTSFNQNYKNVPINNTNVGTLSHSGDTLSNRPRPQPIAGTPPPDPLYHRIDLKLVEETCALYGLNMERPPQIPPSRSYTVISNLKFPFPQTRSMKTNFPEDSSTSKFVLLKGDLVAVIGLSPRRGHLIVEHKNRTLHIPYHYLELKV